LHNADAATSVAVASAGLVLLDAAFSV